MIAHSSVLIDDDGVLVVSTMQHMADIGSRGFDYDYPAELLALMSAGRIVAWETGGEGQFPVQVTFAADPPAGSRGGFQMSVPSADTGLVMPYSQFTYAADCAAGAVELTPGLALAFPLPAGEYRVFISLSPAAAQAGFTVTFSPPHHPSVPLTDHLPFLDGTGAWPHTR